MKNRVLVAMSGGVDSSVTAALLKKQGYEVIGATMNFFIADTQRGCCSISGIHDAKKVAEKLHIPYYVFNFKKALDEKVIKDFCREYVAGRTPNPCVRCNQYLKFDKLIKIADSLGCDYFATGHYARVVHTRGGCALKKGRDEYKDQSYFLYRLGQQQLQRVLMPLGEITKKEVREIARRLKLPVADKPGSQEICFVPRDNYRAFLEKRLGKKIKPGEIVDIDGNVLGMHKGICFYTIGQREGLGIAQGYPVYVIKIDSRRNRIVVGRKEEACAKTCVVKDVSFTHCPPNNMIVLGMKIRYNHKEVQAKIKHLGKKRWQVQFKKPQFAITPGQSAVLYDKDTVVGGGIIERVLT